MNIRTTAILFGLLLAAIGVFGMFQWLGVKTPEERRAQSRLVSPTLYQLVSPYDSANDPNSPVQIKNDAKYKLFDRLTIERPARNGRPSERIEFRRQGSQWHIVAPHPLRTNTDEVHKLINQLAAAEHDQSEITQGLAHYGLDQPAHLVKLYRGEEVFTVAVGNAGPMLPPDQATGEQRPYCYYVLSSDQPTTPRAVPTNTISQLLAPLVTFRDRSIFTSSFATREVALSGVKRDPVKLIGILPENAEQAAGMLTQPTRWEFRQPRVGDADLGAVTAVTRELTGLRIERDEDFLADGMSAHELATRYGLDEAKPIYAATLAIQRVGEREPSRETLLVGNPIPLLTPEQQGRWEGTNLAAGGMASAFAPPLTWLPALASLTQPELFQDGYYARMAGSASVFRVPSKVLPSLRKTVDDLRSRALTRLDLGRLDAIDIVRGEEVLHFRRRVMKPDGSSPSDWDLYRPGKGKVGTDIKAMAELIDALNQIDVKSPAQFLDDPARQAAYRQLHPGMPPLDLNFAKPLATITLWEGGVDRDAAGSPTGPAPIIRKDAKPAVRLTISPRDEQYGTIFVRREVGDLPPAILAIKDRWFGSPPPGNPRQPGMQQDLINFSLAELASAGYLRYRDHTVPGITMDQTAEVVLERPGVKYVLEHQIKKVEGKQTVDTWTLREPVVGVSPNAPTFLHFLAQVNAQQLISDQATAAEWEQHGLGDKPWMRITVRSFADDAKKRDEFSLYVGQQTDLRHKYPGFYYARTKFRPWNGSTPESNRFLFLIAPDIIKSLDLELRDGTIFPQEKIAVVQATLAWHLVGKDQKPHTYRLVLQETTDTNRAKTWTVLSLTDNGTDSRARLPQVAPAKVARLYHDGSNPAIVTMGLLNPLLTERFLVHQGKPNSAQRLDPENKEHAPVLVIELKLANNTVRKLILGAEYSPTVTEAPFLAGRTFRLATASSHPQGVFLVPAEQVAELLQGPDFFKPSSLGK